MEQMGIEHLNENKLVHQLIHRPEALLTVFGMFLIVLSIVGLKRISIPWLKLDIEFDVDVTLERYLRIAGFIVGAVCVGTGIFLYGYIN